MTDSTAIEMPLYQSHKKVHALQIKEAFREPSTPETESPPVTLHFVDPDYAALDVPGDVVSRYWPKEGDYLVIYDDGYRSISPKKAFEEGYTKL